MVSHYESGTVILWVVRVLATWTARGTGSWPDDGPYFAEKPVKVVESWKYVDFTYPSDEARQAAIREKRFVPENCVILDVDFWQDTRRRDEEAHLEPPAFDFQSSRRSAFSGEPKIFVSLPRFKAGVPVTLAKITDEKRDGHTLLAPFPSWAAQKEGNCDGVTSVYRTAVDVCDRLWAVDSGRVENFSPTPRQICPPQLLTFDLRRNDREIGRYRIPKSVLDDDSLLVTLAVDARGSDCSDTFVYVADVTAFKLLVYDVARGRSYRVNSDLFYPFPLHGKFDIAGTQFNLMDGLLALALGPLINGDRQLYFHSLASVREGWISTSVLRNRSLFREDSDAAWDLFHVSGPARLSQSATESMSDDGVLFFGLLSQMGLACWNSRTPFTPDNIHIIYQDNDTMQFPSGMKVHGKTVWISTCQIQKFIAGTGRPEETKYRIMVASVDQLVAGTPCDTRYDYNYRQSSSGDRIPPYGHATNHVPSHSLPINHAPPYGQAINHIPQNSQAINHIPQNSQTINRLLSYGQAINYAPSNAQPIIHAPTNRIQSNEQAISHSRAINPTSQYARTLNQVPTNDRTVIYATNAHSHAPNLANAYERAIDPTLPNARGDTQYGDQRFHPRVPVGNY